jgi:hypothetical protein
VRESAPGTPKPPPGIPRINCCNRSILLQLREGSKNEVNDQRSEVWIVDGSSIGIG